MKIFIFLFFVFSCLNNVSAQDLYYKSYEETGFVSTIKEIERGSNFSLLEISITNSDAQGAFAIIAAAVEIGEALGKSHFALVQEYEVEGLYYNRIFFTSDKNEDPKEDFFKSMDERLYDNFEKVGYLDINEYKELFNSGGKN